jgi:uncharacterized protein DUF3253
MGAADIGDAERAILELLARRGPGKTICPSDAARALGGDDGFRPLMGLVRDAARKLVADGRIEVTQRGEPVDLDRARGPIRLVVVAPTADVAPDGAADGEDQADEQADHADAPERGQLRVHDGDEQQDDSENDH